VEDDIGGRGGTEGKTGKIGRRDGREIAEREALGKEAKGT